MKDYSSYIIVKETEDAIHFKLKSSYAVYNFIAFRIAPWFIMICCMAVAPAMKDMLQQPLYSLFYLLMFGVSFMLLLYRYPIQLTFSKGLFTRKVNMFYFSWEEDTQVTDDTILEVKLVRRYRSTAWVFYCWEKDKRSTLFYIPVFFKLNERAKNNFIQAFISICGIRNTK